MFLQSSLEIILAVIVVFGWIADLWLRKESLLVDNVGSGFNVRMYLSVVFGNFGRKL